MLQYRRKVRSKIFAIISRQSLQSPNPIQIYLAPMWFTSSGFFILSALYLSSINILITLLQQVLCCFLLLLFFHDNFIYYFPAASAEQKLSNFNLFFLHIHATCLLITPIYPGFIFTSLEIFQVQQLSSHFLSQDFPFYLYFSFQII